MLLRFGHLSIYEHIIYFKDSSIISKIHQLELILSDIKELLLNSPRAALGGNILWITKITTNCCDFCTKRLYCILYRYTKGLDRAAALSLTALVTQMLLLES